MPRTTSGVKLVTPSFLLLFSANPLPYNLNHQPNSYFSSFPQNHHPHYLTPPMIQPSNPIPAPTTDPIPVHAPTFNIPHDPFPV